MKITLTKQITLYSATVYMKIKKDVLRRDIQEYLNGKRFHDPRLNNRIDHYLSEIEVYENNSLTEVGETVKATGYLPTPEEGKYKIWYTESDEYFGSVIMYFQREKPHDKANVSELNLGLDKKGHFLMSAKEKNGDVEYARFDLLSTELKGTTFKEPENVEIKLLLEDKQKSYMHFEGVLGKDGFIKLNHQKKVDSQEEIEDILSEALSDYSTKDKRLRMRFSPNTSKDLYVNFEDSNLPCNWRGFSGQIDGIKLMPYDEEHAKKWRDYLLRDELAKNYYSPEDFEQKADEINEKAGFDSYKDSLNIPKAKDFATKSQTEFWHLKAPMDLNPNLLFTDISEIITLQKDEKLSFAELFFRLGAGGQNDIAIYYDNYVRNERQQKAAAALMDAIDASKKIIITDMSPQNQKSDFIITKRKDLRLIDLKSGIFAQKTAHDRYLVVVSPNGTKIWVTTNSLDFIRFQENEVTPDTQGKVVQPVTFTPLSISVLDKELLNFVNKEKNGK